MSSRGCRIGWVAANVDSSQQFPTDAQPCALCILSRCRETFSSGSLVIDAALGGGIPKGRIVEVSKTVSMYVALAF